MEQDNSRITELTYKYASGEITPEEREELEAYLAGDFERMARLRQRTDKETVGKKVSILQQWEVARAKSLEKALNNVKLENLSKIRIIRRTLMAAAILLVLAGVGVYKSRLNRVARPQQSVAHETTILPGGDKATLRLADGTVISLTAASKGTIAVQGKTKVVKTASGSIFYAAAGDAAEQDLLNTVSTPRGGQFQVILPDGSRVWLNAASSVTYPASFRADKREVQVTGEAYFDVAKDPRKPFLVRAGDVAIAVLGTGFNISAYPDEPIRTTLIQGVVRVSHESNSLALKPGQQARIGQGELKLIPEIDTASVVAWKNGDFRFRSTPIDEVMRQLSRWYDIQVQYSGAKPQQALTAVVSRNLPASEVFKALEVSGYHFKVVDHRIEVMP